MGKEKCDYDGLMLISLLVGVALGVIITVAIGAILTYESGLAPSFFGAKWWEALTAVGTVGAALAAVFFGLGELRKQRKRRRNKEEFLQVAIRKELELIANSSQQVLDLVLNYYSFGQRSDQWSKILSGLEQKLSTPVIDRLGVELIDLPSDHGSLSIELSGLVSHLQDHLKTLPNIVKSVGFSDEMIEDKIQHLIHGLCTLGIQACYLREFPNENKLEDYFYKIQEKYIFKI